MRCGLESQTSYGGRGGLVGEARASTLGAATAPGPVTGVRVDNRVGYGRLAVSWDAVLGADGYKVQWKSGSEAWDGAREATAAGEAATSVRGLGKVGSQISHHVQRVNLGGAGGYRLAPQHHDRVPLAPVGRHHLVGR